MFKQGQLVKVTKDIVEGCVCYAEAGDYGEVIKPFGQSGKEYLIHMASNKILKLNTSQFLLE